MNWVPINALNKNLLLPLQSLPTQVVSCSFWFILPTIQQAQPLMLPQTEKAKVCSKFTLSKFAAAFSLAFGKQSPTLHFSIPLCWPAQLSAFNFALLCLPFASGRAVRLCFQNLSCFFLPRIPSSNLPHTFSFSLKHNFRTSNFVFSCRHLEIPVKCSHCPPLNLPLLQESPG